MKNSTGSWKLVPIKDVSASVTTKINRDSKGHFSKRLPREHRRRRVLHDHDYSLNHKRTNIVASLADESWKIDRRIVEWETLLSNLQFCNECGLGPVPLSYNSIQGEIQKGLGGYLYVKCSNTDFGFVNRAAYGKTYREPTNRGRQGMPCFVVNAKLGTAMIDSLGGPKQANNMLATLNLKSISDSNLKLMEKRAGDVVEKISAESTHAAANEAYRNEMLNCFFGR